MRQNPGDLVGGKYRITRLIGDGGMGAVYEARHEVLGSLVALKFLHAELARKAGLASRFLQEAKVSASIQSPHVTRVTDVDTASNGAPYLVMELLNGESLQQVLDRRGKLPKDQAVDFALQVLSGLEAAHALGVVHRDLKPDNVYVTPSSGGPVVKLLDFGIAKLRESNEFQKGLTRPGALMGTPEYMAPEQLYAADRVDHRADLYSLGAILYEMLSGERPAYGEDATQIVGKVAAGKVKHLEEHDPSLPKGLSEVVHRALSADKNQRFPSASDMRLALAAFAGQLSHAGRLAATAPRASTAALVVPRPEQTVDAPPLAVANPALTGTWSPDALSESGKGGTQEAPKGLIRELTAPHAERIGPAYTAPAPIAGADPSYYQPAVPTPYGAAAPGPAGYAAYRSAPGSSQSYQTIAKAKSNRLLGALIALALGVMVTGVVVLAVAVVRRKTADSSPPPSATATTPPATTISAQIEPTEVPPPIPSATPSAARPIEAKPPTRPRRKDAGKEPEEDAGQVVTIPMPGGLPPIRIPPFPPGLPQIPGLPFPTGQPAPAPSQ